MKKLVKKIKKPIIGVWARLYRHLTLKVIYPREYKKYMQAPINEKKVVFIEMRFSELGNSFHELYDKIVQNYNLEVHTHFLQVGFSRRLAVLKKSKEMIRDIATAKYIFIAEASDVMASLDLRRETKFMQLWHACGAFKKFGFSTADLIFGASRKVQEKYKGYGPYTWVTVSSPEIVWAYAEAMRVPKEIIKPFGVSRTDIFFNEEFIRKSYQKLHEIMPASQGKKVILYAPTFRGRIAKAKAPNELDVAQFKEQLSDEYVLVMKHHPFVKKRPEVAEEHQDFACDLTESLKIEELLCVADICVSDYSSIVYEYSLFGKPMIFYAYDLDVYNDWRGFYYSYEELTPGPIFKENEEMISYIKQIENKFDKEEVKVFRDKFMSACDGEATQRIMDAVFENNIERYKREQPVKRSDYEYPKVDIS